MKKINKSLAVVISVCVFATAFGACTNKANQNATVTDVSASVTDEFSASTTAQPESSTQSEKTTEIKTTKNQTTTAKATEKEDSKSYSIKQSLEALSNYYGKGYDVNGTVAEGDYYFFAIYKNNEKYASVKVNLKNGDAVETRTSTGEKSALNLFV